MQSERQRWWFVNNTEDSELEKELYIILTANMPIHAEHDIDKRNILQAIMPLITQRELKARLDENEQIKSLISKPVLAIDSRVKELNAQLNQKEE